MSDIIIPGRDKEYRVRMSLAAFKKIAAYVLENTKMKPGDYFTLTGTDQSKIKILLDP